MIYCMIPVAHITDEMLSASTTPDLGTVRITPEGRVVLCYIGAPPTSATRFVTREGSAAADAWLSSRPEPADVAEWVAAEQAQRQLAIEALEGRR